MLGFISMHGHNSLLALNWPAGMTVWKTKASCHHIIISNQHVSCFYINLWLCLRLNACPRSLSHFIKQIANVIAQSGEGETRASQWIAFKYLWFFDLQYCLRHGAPLSVSVKMHQVNITLHPGRATVEGQRFRWKCTIATPNWLS